MLNEIGAVEMCESKVFLIKDGKKEKVMDEASLVRVEGGMVVAIGLFGERKEVEGEIVEVDAERHEVVISGDDRTQD
ncbi:MAG: CooT family nickel-binding protein [Candidatus Hydrothermarchaeaceae archaeon]